MAFISYDDDNPRGLLAELYATMVDPRSGRVDNILRIHSHNPASLAAHFELYKTLMRGRSDPSRLQREMIAVVVSRHNECHY